MASRRARWRASACVDRGRAHALHHALHRDGIAGGSPRLDGLRGRALAARATRGDRRERRGRRADRERRASTSSPRALLLRRNGLAVAAAGAGCASSAAAVAASSSGTIAPSGRRGARLGRPGFAGAVRFGAGFGRRLQGFLRGRGCATSGLYSRPSCLPGCLAAWSRDLLRRGLLSATSGGIDERRQRHRALRADLEADLLERGIELRVQAVRAPRASSRSTGCRCRARSPSSSRSRRRRGCAPRWERRTRRSASGTPPCRHR